MKHAKKILSLLLALVMLTTMFTSSFYASAKENEYEQKKTSISLEQLVGDLLGEYTEGEALVQFVNELVRSTIEGKLVFDDSGRKIIKGLDPEMVAGGDASIDEAYKKYIGTGDEIVTLGDEKLMELLNTQEVMGVPLMQYRNVKTLDALVSGLLLADNSDILVKATGMLSAMFPNVQPTYDSIVSCLIPILSTLNIDDIVANIDNLTGYVLLAKPSAFAYLAGINSELLDADYLAGVNAKLAGAGYEGEAVEPIITLSAEKQAALLEYVAMEKAGEDLAAIAEAGFVWSDYTDGASNLDIANAFVKMALGDEAKLGGLAADQSLGRGLINLLCDLLNDLQKAPVSTILKKLSDAEGLAAIADFAIGLLSGEGDPDFKSYDLYFFQSIYYDGEGNPTFYDALVEDPETGANRMVYTGPQALSIYIPVIAAALDFTNGLYEELDANDGDLIKTLTIDKLPALITLLKSLVSFTDDNGEEQVGLVGYLLDNYKEYLLANNAVMSIDVLISIAAAAITVAEQGIAAENVKIAALQVYLEQAQQNADAQKLAMAKYLGILDESVTAYSDEAVTAAIEQKMQALGEAIAALNGEIEADAAALEALRGDADAAQATLTKFEAFFKDITKDDLYDDICAIFDENGLAALEGLREAYETYVDDNLGNGKFDELASLITDNFDDYEDDGDSFIDDFIKKKTGGEGLGLTAYRNTLIANNTAAAQAVTDAEAALQEKQDNYDELTDQLNDLETGAIVTQIAEAGANATIHISDGTLKIEGDFTVANIQERIDNITLMEVAKYQQTIAEQSATINLYNAEKAERQAFVDAYDLAGLKAEQGAINELADALQVFIAGDENTKSLYEYLEAGEPIEMVFAPDRMAALKGIVDGAITLVGEKLPALLGEENTLSDNYVEEIWAIEAAIFGENGILTTFYGDFLKDPVLCVVSRIAPIAALADNVYNMGLFTDILDAFKPVIEAAASLFGDEQDGFIALWQQPYADGSADHHYINALMSLIPRIVAIYDQAQDVEMVQEFLGDYSDVIELALGFIGKDFYDKIIADGFVQTILDKDSIKDVLDLAIEKISASDLEDKELIITVINTLYNDVLKTLYEDLLANPAATIASRSQMLAVLAKFIATDRFDFDIDAYQNTVNTRFFKGFIDMIPAEYQELIPSNIVATFTLFVRTLLFGDQYVAIENVADDFDANTYFYFTPDVSMKYYVYVAAEDMPESIYFDGADVKLITEEDKTFFTADLTAGRTYEMCINSETIDKANVLIEKEPHEHICESYTLTTAPTCEKEGVETGACSICGIEMTRPVAALGHDWGEWEITTPAGCTTPGEKTRVCTKDNTHIETDVIPATGHDFSDNAKECRNGCGTPNPDYVAPHEHDYEAVVTAPTATMLGYTTHTCACGDSYVDTYTAPTGKQTLKCAARTANAEKVQWNNVKTATGYQVQISTKDGKKWDKYFTLKAGVLNATFKSLAAGTAYKFRVRFYIAAPDGKNYYSPWSGTLTSPTLPAGTTLTKLAAGKKSFTAQWKANKAVTGYQIQYGLKSSFSGSKTLTVKSYKTLKATVKKLSAKKVYYVRIRTYKTISKVNYFSNWSKTYKVKTK